MKVEPEPKLDVKKVENGEEEEKTEVKKEDDQDDDDPVVHEIPVFLAKSLAGKLYVFQYPLRPTKIPYDTSTIFESRFKPEQGQAELSLELDTKSENFDASKAEQIALNVDGSGPAKNEEARIFPNGTMDRQVLTSMKAVQDPSRYAVGILDANELHITPLSGILNLRPNLSYLDKSDKTAKSEGRVPENPDDPDVPEDEFKPVTVKFVKTDVESAKKNLEKTYDYQQRKANEEMWVPTKYNHLKSEAWEKQSQKMFCKNTEEEITCFNLPPEKYLESLK